MQSSYAQQAANSVIEQSRLLQQQPSTLNTNVNANGVALAGTDDGAVADDSFGSQIILKNQERRLAFTINGDASFIYTSNVALTRRDTRSDGLYVGSAGFTWARAFSSHLEAQFAAHASGFRYANTPELDFENLGAGVGISWTTPRLPGVAAFARYDFTELLSTSGKQILRDHQFSIGAQKSFVFGRSHALMLGVLGSAGISDPHSARRDQIGAFIAYHIKLTRSVESDVAYSPAGNFYPNGRRDLTHVLSWNFKYRFNQWSEANLFFSFAENASNREVFEYTAWTGGAGAGLALRF
ncbi:MAG: hypothetical protein ABJB22_03720 [Verrucomicrobiota bacterium]